MTINKIHARNRAQSIARGPIPFMSLLAGGSAVIGMAVGAGLAQPATAAPVPAVVQPAEDDPAFDCRIHGNKICGQEVSK